MIQNEQMSVWSTNHLFCYEVVSRLQKLSDFKKLSFLTKGCFFRYGLPNVRVLERCLGNVHLNPDAHVLSVASIDFCRICYYHKSALYNASNPFDDNNGENEGTWTQYWHFIERHSLLNYSVSSRIIEAECLNFENKSFGDVKNGVLRLRSQLRYRSKNPYEFHFQGTFSNYCLKSMVYFQEHPYMLYAFCDNEIHPFESNSEEALSFELSYSRKPLFLISRKVGWACSVFFSECLGGLERMDMAWIFWPYYSLTDIFTSQIEQQDPQKTKFFQQLIYSLRKCFAKQTPAIVYTVDYKRNGLYKPLALWAPISSSDDLMFYNPIWFFESTADHRHSNNT